MRRWLLRVRHDLIKHALWQARDLHEAGQAPGPDDLRRLQRALLELPGADGTPGSALKRWRELTAELGPLPPAAQEALADFAQAIAAAQAAVQGPAPALDAVLGLEPAFQALSQRLLQ
jgi:hypothetical protein